MAKVLRSLRVDDKVFDYIDAYNDLRVRLGMQRLPIGDIVADAVRYFLSDQMVRLRRQAADVIRDLDDMSTGLRSQDGSQQDVSPGEDL